MPPTVVTVDGRECVLGIDVASHQHPDNAPIDWAAVAAAGWAFVIVKATEGVGYVNPFFAQDVAGARAAGLDAALLVTPAAVSRAGAGATHVIDALV